MMFAGAVYESAEMPPDVAAFHAEHPDSTTKMTSEDGHHYMVYYGIAYRATGERVYPGIDWSRIKK